MVLAAYIILPLRILVFIQSLVWNLRVRARVTHNRASVRANRVACMRSLLDRYVRICAVPWYVRTSYSDVFETIVRALELSISERLDSVPSTSTTPSYTLPRPRRREIPSRRCFPCVGESDEGDTYGARGRERGRWNLFNADISRERARYRDCLREPGLRLRERRKWDFCVDAAGSFFCSRGLFTQNDRLPMRPPPFVYPPCIHLVSLSGRKSGVHRPFARVVDTARGDRNTGDVIRSNQVSCSCTWRCACKFACKWPR